MTPLPLIDVVVPVYRDMAATRRCLESVFAARGEHPIEIVVVNDATPEPVLAAYLQDLRTAAAITLIENATNCGFIASVNTAMALHPDRDVVLLNSDTEVASGWLDRIMTCAQSDSQIGTVTPFSNNATICSYPSICESNELPEGYSTASLDLIFSRVNAGKSLDIPTAVGFCMYIKRACLLQIGQFDELSFGKGYGEECDFSMRAAAAGWRHVLAADVFVFHEGGASFQQETAARQRAALLVLRRLHPRYERLVQKFVIQDPAFRYRQAVNVELCRSRIETRPVMAAQEAVGSAIHVTSKVSVACIYSDADDSSEIAATVASIQRSALAVRGIMVLTDPHTGSNDVAAASPGVRFCSAKEGLVALRQLVGEVGASGVFFVAAGVQWPNAFDVRIMRAAELDPAANTISPFYDLADQGDRVARNIRPDEERHRVPALDGLLFMLGTRGNFPVQAFNSDCFYLLIDHDRMAASSAFTSSMALTQLVVALRQPNVRHVVTDATCVSALPVESRRAHWRLPADADRSIIATSRRVRLAAQAGAMFHELPGVDSRPVQLHVIHGLAGGSSKWVREYGQADNSRINMVLRSYSQESAFGAGVALYTHVDDEVPLQLWKFAEEIEATTTGHAQYRELLEEVIRNHCVDAILVSSLIGHSLDVLETGLPTVVVSHDYFPYCPTINIFFNSVCKQCDGARIGQCHRENVKFDPFPDFGSAERVAVRERYLELICQANVVMATPSASVQKNLVQLNPRFKKANFITIPHGHAALPLRREFSGYTSGRLRIVVLGELSEHKGLQLFGSTIDALAVFADVHLLGCRERGELFRHRRNVHIVDQYDSTALAQHVEAIQPHVGLLLSICPETFCYALSELMALGIPTAATRLGALAERIRHLETGYLYEPAPDALLEQLRAIDADRVGLARISKNLMEVNLRSAIEMVGDYHGATPLESKDVARYSASPAAQNAVGRVQVDRDEVLISQVLTIANIRKELQSVGLRFTMLNQAHEETVRELEHAKQAQLNFAIARTESVRQLHESERHIAGLDEQLQHRDARIQDLLQSTSWRLTAPVRLVGLLIRRGRVLISCLWPVVKHPTRLPFVVQRLREAWAAGGLFHVKRSLLALPNLLGSGDAFADYRRVHAKFLLPALRKNLETFTSRPLISIIVPIFNTPEPLLQRMLQSVQGQIYPNWELCLVDDASTAPHVGQALARLAAEDKRVKLKRLIENGGVSHASNRALEMVSGEYVVLLDHDDILEEQALYRFAESILSDRPDFIYSDEIRVESDGESIDEFIFRPAFSLERLRSHPYIVHLSGFRTALLREIGGFDESLKISQDYDLILRVAEKARSVVHIPEILYRWRVHDASEGHRRMGEVMEVSTAVLERHLARCGVAGRAGPGASFNLFETRYSLLDSSRVGIIIPTKNHGELLRQCVDSILATVRTTQFHILIVDHDSDEPETLAYLDAVAGKATVVRYSGEFNFSKINNWAVAQLGEGYSHFLFCNNDVEALAPGWLERMLELGQQTDVGIVGCKLFYPDRKTIQHAGVCVGAYTAAEHYGKFMVSATESPEPGYMGGLVVNHEVMAVTAACMLMSKAAFREVGGFDEAIAVGFGDVDLCLRAGIAGYRILYCAGAELVHHESKTRGISSEDSHPADTALFREKWRGVLSDGDYFYNPSLSLMSTGWDVKLPIESKAELRRRVYSRDPERGRVIMVMNAEKGLSVNAAKQG